MQTSSALPAEKLFQTNCVPQESVGAQYVSRGPLQRTCDGHAQFASVPNSIPPLPGYLQDPNSNSLQKQAFRTIHWTVWIWTWGHNYKMKLEKYGQNKGRGATGTPKTCTITGLDGASQGEIEGTSRQMWNCRGTKMRQALSPRTLPLLPRWLSNI